MVFLTPFFIPGGLSQYAGFSLIFLPSINGKRLLPSISFCLGNDVISSIVGKIST